MLLDDIFIKDRQYRVARTPGTNDCPARNPFSLLIGSFVIQHHPQAVMNDTYHHRDTYLDAALQTQSITDILLSG